MEQELEQLRAQVAELMKWKKEREVQQLSWPVDIASRNALGAPYGEGAGNSALTQAINVTTTPLTINVPKAYVQTFFLVVNGVRYEVPSLI